MIRRTWTLVLALGLASALSACSGGDGGSDPSSGGPSGDGGGTGDAGSGGASAGGGGGDGTGSGSSGALPAWVANLPLWQWYRIPNTRLSSVDPTPRPLGVTGPASKIDAWCGATLKRAGSVYLLGAAGGHNDYGGNEVDALALNTAAPRWVQLRGPTPNAQVVGDTQFFLDLRPSPTHTYYATQFIESQDRMIVFNSPGVNGSAYPPAPADFAYTGNARSFVFDLGTNDWEDPDFLAPFPGSGDWTACLVVKHPVTEDVYRSPNAGSGWYRWRPSTNAWTRLSDTSRGSWYGGAAIDPQRNHVLVVGSYNADPPEVFDLDGNGVPVTFGGLGASVLARSGYPGVVFDEANDRFLVFFNDGSSIRMLRVHPTTWVIDEPATTGPRPEARTNGIQGSAQYVPELRGIVIANRHDGDVYFLRTAP